MGISPFGPQSIVVCRMVDKKQHMERELCFVALGRANPPLAAFSWRLDRSATIIAQ